MNVTKFPQSCLKIEKAGQSILVDLGSLATAEFTLDDFGKFDAVLFTHSHPDHLDLDIIDDLVAQGVSMYGNADVAEKAGQHVEVIEDGEELVVAGFKIKAHHMEHCLMVDGSKTVPNTGFVVDGHLLLPGDSTEDVGITAEVVALPIFGPDISFKDANSLAVATKAKRVIPVHYDVVGMDASRFGYAAKAMGGSDQYKVTHIANGDSIEI
jgi:L-ascorbate metabolism protein UlaG (beta-lactamase superfamily)